MYKLSDFRNFLNNKVIFFCKDKEFTKTCFLYNNFFFLSGYSEKHWNQKVQKYDFVFVFNFQKGKVFFGFFN